MDAYCSRLSAADKFNDDRAGGSHDGVGELIQSATTKAERLTLRSPTSTAWVMVHFCGKCRQAVTTIHAGTSCGREPRGSDRKILIQITSRSARLNDGTNPLQKVVVELDVACGCLLSAAGLFARHSSPALTRPIHERIERRDASHLLD